MEKEQMHGEALQEHAERLAAHLIKTNQAWCYDSNGEIVSRDDLTEGYGIMFD